MNRLDLIAEILLRNLRLADLDEDEAAQPVAVAPKVKKTSDERSSRRRVRKGAR